MMPATNKEKWYKLSISQIFPNKKRRNLKKGKTIDRYSFERRNQGRGKQKNGEMGSPRTTVCRPRRQEKKEKVNQYRGSRSEKKRLLNGDFYGIGINGIGCGRNFGSILHSPRTASAIIKN